MEKLRILSARAFSHDVPLRMPFRFGISEVREVPHVFLQVEIAVGRRTAIGISAENLMPKWFTKNLGTSFPQDVAELAASVTAACGVAEAAGEHPTLFRLWLEIYRNQKQAADGRGWPALLAGLGSSLVERALIDAFCRLESVGFHEALRSNLFGLELAEFDSQLSGIAPSEVIPARPLTETRIRHTVGLSDPLCAEDANPHHPPVDSLPFTLQEAIRRYGLMRFKIKISDDTSWNLRRLRSIAAVIDAETSDWLFTLDGNESYRDPAEFIDFWKALAADDFLRPALGRLRFIEQPLHRDVSFDGKLASLLPQVAVPVIIDESDADLDTFPLALSLGYKGTSHKNCKGVFKSVANLARLAANPGGILSGEDLTTIGPVALLEDLCVVQSLGLDDIERNGHHYIGGLSAFPRHIQEQLFARHSDLYEESADGTAVLRIVGGRVRSATLHHEGLGPRFLIDPRAFAPLRE